MTDANTKYQYAIISNKCTYVECQMPTNASSIPIYIGLDTSISFVHSIHHTNYLSIALSIVLLASAFLRCCSALCVACRADGVLINHFPTAVKITIYLLLLVYFHHGYEDTQRYKHTNTACANDKNVAIELRNVSFDSNSNYLRHTFTSYTRIFVIAQCPIKYFSSKKKKLVDILYCNSL